MKIIGPKTIAKMRILVSVALCSSYLLEFIHFTLVRHVRCSEHDEWVDSQFSQPAVPLSIVDSLSIEIRDIPKHHDHCVVFNHHRGFAHLDKIAVSNRAHHDDVIFSGGAENRASLLSPLSYAPKQSPPLGCIHKLSLKFIV